MQNTVKMRCFSVKKKSCETAICPSCLSAKHLGHQVVEILETKQEVLEVVLKKAGTVSQILDQKIEKMKDITERYHKEGTNLILIN